MIPNKSNFKFQELTPITGVKPYVLRFWETEFPEIAPLNSDSGQKLYSKKDIEVILTIKKLLFEQKLSIPEAKLAIKEELDSDAVAASLSSGNPAESGEGKISARELILEALGAIHEIKLRRNW